MMSVRGARREGTTCRGVTDIVVVARGQNRTVLKVRERMLRLYAAENADFTTRAMHAETLLLHSASIDCEH